MAGFDWLCGLRYGVSAVVVAVTATLETQQNWLHLEQLRSEVGGLRETMQYLIDYLAERDGGGAG